jgi:hypothetical protein
LGLHLGLCFPVSWPFDSASSGWTLWRVPLELLACYAAHQRSSVSPMGPMGRTVPTEA